MEKKKIFLIMLILGTAFWGISFSVTKLAIGHASSSTFLFYRFLAATAVLSIIFSKKVKAITWDTIKTGIGLAVPLTFGIGLQTLGIKYSPASQCAFVAGMCVVIIPMMKIIFYKAFPPVKVWVAAFIALAGLFVISIKTDLSINIGDLYTIAGAFAFAFYLIKVEKDSVSHDMVATVVPMFATCAVITGCMALADHNANWAPQNNQFWIGIVFCSLFSTAYMYTVSNVAQRYISAERVAVIYLFEPVFGAIAAFFILGEALSWRLLLGGSLIFAAMLISELKYTRWSLLKSNA
jgi:drug/metabolite transporter (DMT)-like permease